MSEVGAILKTGRSFRLESSRVTPGDIWAIEEVVKCALPAEYHQFVELGGLEELNFDHEVLSPRGIEQALPSVGPSYVPFASNGCGDLFCWRTADLPDSIVFFLDHDGAEASQYAESFLDCIRLWRRQ